MQQSFSTYRLTYPVIVDRLDAPSGVIFGAFAPEILGCTAVGKTFDGVLAEMRRALRASVALHSQEGTLPAHAKSLDELLAEYALEREELLSETSVVVMIEVSLDAQLLRRPVAAAA